MVVMFVRFESALTEDEVLAVANERLGEFQALPGLLQKYYVKPGPPNHYGGIYIWDSKESMQAFRETDLAKSIPTAYQVVGAPVVEVMEGFITLRE